MNFQERLRKIVAIDYNSQVDLAEHLGLSKVAINSYTSGKRKPNFEVLEKFHNLGYSIDWLVSGKGSMKRSFLNIDELDNYDRVVFDFFQKTSNSSHKKEGHDSKNNKSTSLSSLIKLYVYQRFSYKSLKWLVWGSESFSEIRESYSDNRTLQNIEDKLEQIVNLIINGVSIQEEDKLTIEIKPHIKISRFRNIFSRYIYLSVEIEIFKRFIDETNQSNFFMNSELYEPDLNDIDGLEDLDYLSLSVEPKKEFKQLKSNYKALVDQINDMSYTDSKVIIFSGIVNNIFKFEQSKK